MKGTITPKQALIMWCLLGQHGWALQGKVVPKVEKKDRDALEAGGYIKSWKADRGALVLKVDDDKGWRWGSDHLREELPPNFQVLQNWLARLHEYLERSGETFPNFIGPAPTSPPGPPKPKAKKPTAAQLRKRIEEAYLAVTGDRKAEQALLSKVRAHLSDLDRKTVDEGLLRILQGDNQGKKKARLGQISDPKTLSQDDREAAFTPGGEPFHLLWIQS
jgi:hypothetical protein